MTLGKRYERIPRERWEEFDGPTRGLDADLRTLEEAITLFVKPNMDGSWPYQDRSSGARPTLMWLRNINASELAPLPVEADGYLPGDLVFPVLAVATETPPTTPTSGVLASDTLLAASVSPLDGRTGDAFAGGTPPSWHADLTGNPTKARARIQPTTGLELYSNAYAVMDTPGIPTTGDVRVSFEVSSLAANQEAGLAVLGATHADPAATTLTLRNTSGAATISVIDRTSGTPTLTALGSAPWTDGTTVKATLRGQVLTVEVGAWVSPACTLSATPRQPRVASWAGWYSSVSFRNLRLEKV